MAQEFGNYRGPEAGISLATLWRRRNEGDV